VQRHCELTEGDCQNILREAPDNLSAIIDLFSHLASLAKKGKSPEDNLVGWCVLYWRANPRWANPRASGVPTFAEFQTRQNDRREIELQKRSKNANISSSDDQRSREGTDGLINASNGPKKPCLMHLGEIFTTRSLEEQKAAEDYFKKERSVAIHKTISEWLAQDRPGIESSFFQSHFANLGRAEERLQIIEIKKREQEAAAQLA
jgi:hypothetical protein